MKTISPKEFYLINDIDLEQMPFCLQRDYLEFDPANVIIQWNDFFCVLKIQAHKFLTVARFQCVPVDKKGKRLGLSDEKEFCEKSLEFIKVNKLAHRIQAPPNHVLFYSVPGQSIVAPFGTYRVSLDKHPEEILRQMQPRYRSAIREVEKMNVEIKFGTEELNAFYKLHRETMQRGSFFSDSYEKLHKEALQLKNNVLVATIYIDNKLQGGLYLAYSPFSAYYLHGASTNDTIASGAIKYLHYNIMCLMKEKNVKYYDFVGARLTDISGTKLEGIQNFKKRFGAELVKGYLWKADLDPFRGKLFDTLLALKCVVTRTTFPKDIIDQEKQKALVL